MLRFVQKYLICIEFGSEHNFADKVFCILMIKRLTRHFPRSVAICWRASWAPDCTRSPLSRKLGEAMKVNEKTLRLAKPRCVARLDNIRPCLRTSYSKRHRIIQAHKALHARAYDPCAQGCCLCVPARVGDRTTVNLAEILSRVCVCVCVCGKIYVRLFVCMFQL